MNYGFLIRNDRCIGCHACSTACKSENEVPLGVNRTWVKSVEKGVFPDSRRHFQVTRCNHCENPPCVEICPVKAMYQREDGIVEFDGNQCIGCKACLQACPYDAIHIDPDSGTAAKCHYCAHRVDLGMEPACVVVCPEHAIIAGDLDNPSSEIAMMLAENMDISVRKPEAGTRPNVFYFEGEPANLQPTAVSRTPASFAWADVVSLHGDGEVVSSEPAMHEENPIQIGDGRMAEQMVQVAYNAQHKIPWHWQVPAYLVTKGIATGSFLFLAAAYFMGQFDLTFSLPLFGSICSVVFTLLTTVLLVFDLEKPERFLKIVFQPQLKSWLAKGAFLLIGFSTVSGIWMVLEWGASLGWWEPELYAAALPYMMAIGVPLALGTAIYTAFLFWQAKGRDLWQSRMLPVHLLIEAGLAGSAALLIVSFFAVQPEAVYSFLRSGFVAFLVLNTLLFVYHAAQKKDRSTPVGLAVSKMKGGYYKGAFWLGAGVIGIVLPALLLMIGWNQAGLVAAAGVAAIVGLLAYEYAFVMAPQEVPNS